jgi:L-aspartate oxidase
MKNYDVIIAGTGSAGLYAAINLPSDMNILLLCKKELSLCNSALAQGGIAGVVAGEVFAGVAGEIGNIAGAEIASEKNEKTTKLSDSITEHQKDTFVAGGFKNNPEAVEVLTEEAGDDIRRIIELGVEFDKNADGSYSLTLEGGHSHKRIFHKKDETGKEIVSKLQNYVSTLTNVTILQNTYLFDVKKTSTGFSVNTFSDGNSGVRTDENPNYGSNTKSYNTHNLILATGGIGRVYERTTNAATATGDGIAIAEELGAEIKDISLIQFHPTAFNGTDDRERFLISEAVRGEGAYLLNQAEERFMQRYDERLELAPRDVVSKAIIKETKLQESEIFYLDVRHKDPEFMKNRFPMIYGKLLENGIDFTKDLVPIYPCQHYLMGGINVDTYARTNIKGLYAVGECAHTGVHGLNRLASNSLLETLVFSRRAASDIAKNNADTNEIAKNNADTNEIAKNNADTEFEDYKFKYQDNSITVPTGIRTEIRHIMQTSYFVVKDKTEVLSGFERLKEIKKMLTNDYTIDTDYIEAKSLCEVAYLILEEVI